MGLGVDLGTFFLPPTRAPSGRYLANFAGLASPKMMKIRVFGRPPDRAQVASLTSFALIPAHSSAFRSFLSVRTPTLRSPKALKDPQHRGFCLKQPKSGQVGPGTWKKKYLKIIFLTHKNNS